MDPGVASDVTGCKPLIRAQIVALTVGPPGKTRVDPSDEELRAYLDEMLSPERSVAVEKLLRDRSDLRQRTALLARHRDQGGHSVGEIWRRHRLTCPTRAELGNFLLGIAPPDVADYIVFHLNVIECRTCLASRDDLLAALQDSDTEGGYRERRYFESSAGLLRSQPKPPE